MTMLVYMYTAAMYFKHTEQQCLIQWHTLMTGYSETNKEKFPPPRTDPLLSLIAFSSCVALSTHRASVGFGSLTYLRVVPDSSLAAQDQ
jgi:hypothetical protein